jgi:hypothetical protein
LIRWALAAGSLVVALAALTLVRGPGRTGARAPAAALAAFNERDVRVALALDCESSGRGWLSARFTPLRAGFHLYGMELPRDGLSGIGRPTLLEVVHAPGLRLAGPIRADRPTEPLRDSILELTFPVYPAGPVTLRAPVAFAAPGPLPAELSVTYMTCNGRRCLPPTVDRRVQVVLPGCG